MQPHSGSTMNKPDPDPQVDDLLKQGIEAAHDGNKAVARALLEQVVQLDERNEKAWFWLAAVTDDLHEKRVCLTNVIVINPGNKRAQELLARLEGTAVDERTALVGKTKSISKPVVYLAIGLGVVAIAVLLIVVVLMLGDSDTSGSESLPTIANSDASGNGDTGATTAETASADHTPGSQTGSLSTRTVTPPPPTWTPVPTKTPVPDVLPTLFPPPPTGLPGQIIMRSGQVPGDPDNQPIVLVKPDGSEQHVITPGNTRGHAPALSPDGRQFAYVMYAPGTREFLLQLNNVHGTFPRPASSYWAGIPTLQNQGAPAWSPDGAWLAFSARGLGAITPDLFRVLLADPAGDPEALERLTEDDAIESWPAYSPVGNRIVYAADMSKLDFNASTELLILDLETRQITNLTDNGSELIEAAPDWSPDGQFIVFHAAPAGSTDTDIYRIHVSDGPAEKIIDSDSQDIQPRYSPDGNYLVFSSNRTGNWDVFVYDFATETLYQLTTSPHTDVANDWGP